MHKIGLTPSIPVRRSPAALSRRFAQICNAILAESLSDEDLSPLHYAILGHLTGEPDLDQNGLAARLAVDRTNVGVLTTYLEERGLVTRRVDGTDRRARLVRLTSAGARLYARLSLNAPIRQRQMLAALNAQERKIFLELLLRIVITNETYARPGAGRRKRRSPLNTGKGNEH